MITVFVLLLFQEVNFNVMKTHLFQNMAEIKIDPRITEVKFFREDKMLEGTIPHLYGEGMKPNPPLEESLPYFSEIGEVSYDNNLPFSDVNFNKSELMRRAKEKRRKLIESSGNNDDIIYVGDDDK